MQYYCFRTATRHLAWRSSSSDDVDVEFESAKSKFSETCLRLAKHLLDSEDDDYKKSLPYFRMSGRSMSQVLKEVEENKDKDGKGKTHQISPGLLHYIREDEIARYSRLFTILIVLPPDGRAGDGCLRGTCCFAVQKQRIEMFVKKGPK